MGDLRLSEIKVKKELFENEVRKLANKFTQETNMNVKKIALGDKGRHNEYNTVLDYNVIVLVELPFQDTEEEE